MDNSNAMTSLSREALYSIYKSKCNLLEKTLFRFFEQFQGTIERLFDNETKAFEYIHQIDNHLNQMRLCQKVITTDLPANLNEKVKDGLLTKIYLKILFYIDKLKHIKEHCEKEVKIISEMSFECICVANQIPPIHIQCLCLEQNDSFLSSSNIQDTEDTKRNTFKVLYTDEILTPTSKRISLAQLLECASKITLILTNYICQLDGALNSKAFVTIDTQSTLRKVKTNDSIIECPKWIDQLFPSHDEENENYEESRPPEHHKSIHDNTVGNLAFLISKQSIGNAISDSSDNLLENEEYETKQGKHLKIAFTFLLKHKVDIQQIMFETSFFIENFKTSRKAMK